jgi:hypothetical protein
MEVVDGLEEFMFMHAILPQEWFPVLIDNSVDTIDLLDRQYCIGDDTPADPALLRVCLG